MTKEEIKSAVIRSAHVEDRDSSDKIVRVEVTSIETVYDVLDDLGCTETHDWTDDGDTSLVAGHWEGMEFCLCVTTIE